jgi:predicted RNase H-like HicB family nuclease
VSCRRRACEKHLSAYVPHLPGCITTGRTAEEIDCNIREAIELHLAGMREGVGYQPVGVRRPGVE